MLCGKSPVKGGGGSTAAVYLNVYDLTAINGYAYWLGLGVYHSGVEVHGVEYAFGAHEYPSTGIFEGEPRQCEGFTFRKSILIGWTDMSPTQVKVLMEQLAVKYRGNAYNLISKNCNHFCNDACIKLTTNPIPNWINRLARIGFLCKCIIPVNLNSTKVGHNNKVQDNVGEGVKKKLKSSSNSSSSSSSPPPTVAAASRSSLLAS
ncbi:deSI-like protein At4g17486 [Salvia hispanica]|uniref:deSI-like protein At4g17486 n=1 Tax=Salvia hispanica TaxID=49212 RepID=UPI002008F383|nr:deSI-like protein At4g17486 [Salvia hispanica]